ncbi:hypothetical protein N7523_007532 [Penicillium sp. IBT 18751x]|nr:hypothetical protein N7523_007532 [Penicillium sp. IBT 18751x]
MTTDNDGCKEREAVLDNINGSFLQDRVNEIEAKGLATEQEKRRQLRQYRWMDNLEWDDDDPETRERRDAIRIPQQTSVKDLDASVVLYGRKARFDSIPEFLDCELENTSQVRESGPAARAVGHNDTLGSKEGIILAFIETEWHEGKIHPSRTSIIL